MFFQKEALNQYFQTITVSMWIAFLKLAMKSTYEFLIFFMQTCVIDIKMDFNLRKTLLLKKYTLHHKQFFNL